MKRIVSLCLLLCLILGLCACGAGAGSSEAATAAPSAFSSTEEPVEAPEGSEAPPVEDPAETEDPEELPAGESEGTEAPEEPEITLSQTPEEDDLSIYPLTGIGDTLSFWHELSMNSVLQPEDLETHPVYATAEEITGVHLIHQVVSELEQSTQFSLL